jgi:hypothetical protein
MGRIGKITMNLSYKAGPPVEMRSRNLEITK